MAKLSKSQASALAIIKVILANREDAPASISKTQDARMARMYGSYTFVTAASLVTKGVLKWVPDSNCNRVTLA